MKVSSDPVLLFVLATAISFVMRGLLKVQFKFYYCFSTSKTLEQVTQCLHQVQIFIYFSCRGV